MVERFFCGSDVEKVIEAQNHCHYSHPPLMLLSGPPSSGKTSLLFQFAVNSAASQNNHIVFICNRRHFETNPPFLSRDIDPSSDIFHRIQMKYVDDDDGIKNYFSAFHLHHTFPSTVIIDDFADFFDERRCKERYGNNTNHGRELAMIGTLALCHNALMHANERRPCKLMLSDTHHGDSPRLLFIYKRWVSTIFTITGDGSGSFTVKSNGNQDNGGPTKTAKYSVALQYLVLEGIDYS